MDISSLSILIGVFALAFGVAYTIYLHDSEKRK